MDDGQLDDLRLEIEELRAARRRLVASADTERCRIERELHDGVQQHLVAVAVNLQVARRLADADASALRSLLEEIRHDVQEALEDLRRLASRVYPAFLRDLGLVEALRAAAAEAVFPIHVVALPPVERYPAEIEAAVYFCCIQAMEARGRRATIRLREDEHALAFDVVVEGGGPGSWAEDDLFRIGDRLGAIGGQMTVSADTGRGACLSGTIPLAPWPLRER